MFMFEVNMGQAMEIMHVICIPVILVVNKLQPISMISLT